MTQSFRVIRASVAVEFVRIRWGSRLCQGVLAISNLELNADGHLGQFNSKINSTYKDKSA